VRRRAYFGLGSNLGDRWAHLQAGVAGLGTAGEDLGVSRIYETVPVGGPGDQGRYLNCVVGITTELEPYPLLELANRLEDEAGRVRLERFGPRTLDVDVLLVEGVISDDPRLVIPHPRMWERSFVLAPLADLDPVAAGAGWVERLGGLVAVASQVRPVGSMLSVAGRVGGGRAP
jgi:2-amino-4-hydroxy-6-hydroxymethyldihydropteridine diphosphokinase